MVDGSTRDVGIRGAGDHLAGVEPESLGAVHREVSTHEAVACTATPVADIVKNSGGGIWRWVQIICREIAIDKKGVLSVFEAIFRSSSKS